MKKWKQVEAYGKVTEELEPQVEGKPWKVTLRCSTFEEADAKRTLLKEKWAKGKLKGAEVKVKYVRGQYTVRVRVPEAPVKQAEEKAVVVKPKKPTRRQQRDEKRGAKRQEKKEAAWKELKEKNESSPV